MGVAAALTSGLASAAAAIAIGGGGRELILAVGSVGSFVPKVAYFYVRLWFRSLLLKLKNLRSEM